MNVRLETNLKEFNESLLKEYEESLTICSFIDVQLVESTDGKFTQVGIRPVLDGDMFTDPSFDPRLPGAGRHISKGELEFLVNQLLNNKNLKSAESRLCNFPIYVEDQESTILFSSNLLSELYSTFSKRLDFNEGFARLDGRQRLIPVHSKIMENKIIVIPKNSIGWEKKLFQNNYTGNKEKLNIIIGKTKSNGKLDITMASWNKINMYDEEVCIIKITPTLHKNEKNTKLRNNS